MLVNNDQYFNNLQNAAKITPKTNVLIIHGFDDALVSFKHAMELAKSIPENVNVELKIQKDMTHNQHNIDEDIVKPIVEFL
jgi:dipeptidyl aminopeptidase/acylaminoacyl peptidase